MTCIFPPSLLSNLFFLKASFQLKLILNLIYRSFYNSNSFMIVILNDKNGTEQRAHVAKGLLPRCEKLHPPPQIHDEHNVVCLSPGKMRRGSQGSFPVYLAQASSSRPSEQSCLQKQCGAHLRDDTGRWPLTFTCIHAFIYRCPWVYANTHTHTYRQILPVQLLQDQGREKTSLHPGFQRQSMSRVTSRWHCQIRELSACPRHGLWNADRLAGGRLT